MGKVVACVFKEKTIGSHSFRKGGAASFRGHGLVDQGIAEQGGWRSVECMQSIYTKKGNNLDGVIKSVVAGAPARHVPSKRRLFLQCGRGKKAS